MRLWGSAEPPVVGSSEVQSSSKTVGGRIGTSNRPSVQAGRESEQEEHRNNTGSATKAEQRLQEVSGELPAGDSKLKPHRCNDRIEDVIQVIQKYFTDLCLVRRQSIP